MKTNNNIPAYRFQGYTDAWELRKLGEVGTVAMCRRIFKEQTSEHGEIPFYKIGTFGGTPDAFIARELFEEFKDKYSYPNIGDILISASGSIGRTVEFLGEDEYFQDSNIVWLKHDGKINNIFLKQFYSIVKWSGIEGSTIKRLYNENILNTEISLPTLPEQKAIGSFFSTLDRQITLHQRKLDTLKQQKKTYLKLLFPAKGQTKPALRFQGFEDDWEIKRISDIGDIVTGNTPSTSNEDYYSKEGMMWVTPTDIDGLIITDTNKKLSPEGEKVSRIVPANSILVTCIASIGKNTLLLEAGSFNQQINAVVPNQSLYYPYFLLTQSYFWSESMKRIAPAATMQIINKNEFSNITVPLPSVPEQEAIGTFFQTLDQEITQVEVKLASLKEMKKTLLRKLFV
ncbi:type IC specificity subunit [Streptococcus suis]|uniref:Type IC specificity subunit n=1 Tax=Streptococcus suis TaxID=1307 RepID=A0A0Z8GCT9_STRSU|nr:restriction endonuclease subunit S [Streptococcus suis]NQH35516.1 restriction endonuclease subunit S [Streptococcus suis]CYU96339.1 type IC specificity subunit [Streptococcus suis]